MQSSEPAIEAVATSDLRDGGDIFELRIEGKIVVRDVARQIMHADSCGSKQCTCIKARP